MIGNYGLPGLQCEAGGRGQVSPDRSIANYTFVPTHAGPDKKPVVGRDVFQDFAVLYAESFRCHACGVIKHICEARTLEGEHAEFGQQLLLSNSLTQRAPSQILGNLVAGFLLNNRLVLIGWWMHSYRIAYLEFRGPGPIAEK